MNIILTEISPKIVQCSNFESIDLKTTSALLVIANIQDYKNQLQTFQVELTRLGILKDKSDDFFRTNPMSVFSNFINYFIFSKLSKRSILDFEISKNKNGKPFIENDSLKFNISHTKDTCAFLFSEIGEVGVDVEKLNSNKRCLQIAKRFFNHEEYEYLLSLDEIGIQKEFFDMWTKKEALVKCLGSQMYYNMQKINTLSSVWVDAPKDVFQTKELFYVHNLLDNKHSSTLCFTENIQTLFVLDSHFFPIFA